MMLDQLVFYESRAAAADPHRDMRLDIDNMSYEDLLALGEFMGNVNTGLADEKKFRSVSEKWSAAALTKCKTIKRTKMTGAVSFAWRITKTRMCWGY